MKPEYEKLRSCICCNDDEATRFRSLVVNSVMATDIMDQGLGAARKARWKMAFAPESDGTTGHGAFAVNRKATIVIEHRECARYPPYWKHQIETLC
jgi:hypothetical protein